MLRRDFLKSSALAPAGAVGGSSSGGVIEPGPTSILTYTAEQHRRRLLNIAGCERSIRKCLRKHHITGYIPGQVAYNFGEYPVRKPYEIGTDYDEAELDRLRDGGIRLIQVMEDWNDLLRLFGGDKFSAVNPSGLRRFIDMVHRRGMKILLYASTSFFQRGDRDFREEWARKGSVRTIHWDLARCSPASPGWRAYLLPRMLRILDDYDIDGLYNDWGYIPLYNNPNPPTQDEVLAFQESAEHDAVWEDLVALVYSEVKRRGGIYKLHADGRFGHPMSTAKLYDYLWVGEGVSRIDKMRIQSRDHEPYVIPCFDLATGKLENEDELYLHTLPYLQFPLLLAGRPFTGERALIPGIPYLSEDKDPRLRHFRMTWKYYNEHPEGPFAYGAWDSYPPRPNVRETHARWLKQYLPLVEEGTWAYLEIADSDLFAQPIPSDVVASAFANLDVYLVLANYGRTQVSIETTQSYTASTEQAGAPRKNWLLEGRSFVILRRSG